MLMKSGMEESIVLQGLSIGYRSGKHLRVVAQGIFASILEGELTCLIGSNGVGKSTLLRTLSTFQPPLAGEISWVIQKERRCSLCRLFLLDSYPNVLEWC